MRPDPGDTGWDARRPRAPRRGRPRGGDLHVGNDGPAEGHHAHARRPRRRGAAGGGGLRAQQRLPARSGTARISHPASSSTRSATWRATAASRSGCGSVARRSSCRGSRSRAVRALLARFEMDSLQLTPTMIHMLATTEEPLDLGGVKYVTSGTAPLSTATRERFEARYGVPVMQAYGMSEVGAVAQERYDDVVAGRRGPGSVGRIAAGVEVKIRPLDDDRPPGEGEILVRTDEASSEFIGGEPVPVDEEGWFATGDVGRIDDDILYITGRVQEKIIVGGFNVYPAEVEDAARRSALVRDAVVVGLARRTAGRGPGRGHRLGRRAGRRRAPRGAARRPRALQGAAARSSRSTQCRSRHADKVDRKRAAEIATPNWVS